MLMLAMGWARRGVWGEGAWTRPPFSLLLRSGTAEGGARRGMSYRRRSGEQEGEEAQEVEIGKRRPLVAIVGCANSGKSTLFNKLVGRSHAIVSAVPGTTRDRSYGVAEWGALRVDLVDTGGLLGDGEGDPLQGRIEEQALVAAAEADVVVFVTDAVAGVQPVDQRVARLLKAHQRERRARTGQEMPVVVLANKCDNPGRIEQLAPQFVRLGFGQPIPISAVHGSGVHDFWDHIRPFCQSDQAEDRLSSLLQENDNGDDDDEENIFSIEVQDEKVEEKVEQEQEQ
ncbi:MAG: GTPase, partial [archaeon]|nr:GTPase [archaeon]